VKVNVVGCTVFEIVVNVFEPLTVNAPTLPLFNVQLYVEPPPANVFAEALVRLIVPVPVPAVVVKPVGAALLKAVPDDEITIVPPLKVRFFVPAAVKKAVVVAFSVDVCPFRSSVPLVSVNEVFVVVDIASASCSANVPLGLLRLNGVEKVFPALVIVWLLRPENVTKLSPKIVVPVPFIQFP